MSPLGSSRRSRCHPGVPVPSVPQTSTSAAAGRRCASGTPSVSTSRAASAASAPPDTACPRGAPAWVRDTPGTPGDTGGTPDCTGTHLVTSDHIWSHLMTPGTHLRYILSYLSFSHLRNTPWTHLVYTWSHLVRTCNTPGTHLVAPEAHLVMCGAHLDTPGTHLVIPGTHLSTHLITLCPPVFPG